MLCASQACIDFYHGLLSSDRTTDDSRREEAVQQVEMAMRSQRIPDTIEELARFWDRHDLTDFEDQLEEIQTPVFVRDKETTFAITLAPEEVQALRRIARSRGVKEPASMREWVREKLHGTLSNKPPNKRMEPTRSGSRKRAAHS